MTCLIRVMEEADLSMVLQWRNDEDVRKNMYTNHIISPEEHKTWWESERNNPQSRLLICELDSSPVGVVIFTRYTGNNGLATWAFYSGDRRKRGVGAAMEVAALNYAFNELRVRKLECEVLSFNDAVIRFHLKHGFRVEGIFREGYVRNGEVYDIYRLAMLSKDWFNYIKSTIDNRIKRIKEDIDYTGKRLTHVVCVDADMVESFADVVNDHNPVHASNDIAKQLGFNGKVSHGMLIGSLFSGYFSSEFPGPGTIYLEQTLEFHMPVIVGTTVKLRLRVLSHIGRQLLVETQVFDGDVLCVSGNAKLLISSNSNGRT